MMMKVINKGIFLKSVILILVILFWAHSNVLARSGCCSHHGGVCGCGCCDGSSLSSTCAPYYPACNDSTPSVKTSKPPTKMYTEVQYNNIVKEKEVINAKLKKIKEDKENLQKEKSDLKNKLAQLNATKTRISEDLENLKNNSKKPNELSKQDLPKENSSSEGNGFLTFLLGGGFMYGLNSLKRRSELRKEGVQIKGNITRDGQKVYYTPSNPYYDMVKIDKKKGEKWFLTEQEAIDSGWHKANY